MVECYLEVGKPFTAVISESVDFFASPELPFISGATVKITHRGETFILNEGLFIDPSSLKLFNYFSTAICPTHFNEDFTIEVTDSLGRVATATTQILEPVLIDTLETVWKENDTLALVLTRFMDPPEVKNYYRRMFQAGGELGEGEFEQDFTTSDNFVDDDHQVVYGSGFDFVKGDTIISTLYNIDQSYHDFRESIIDAINSNGNPFAQPGIIKSNINGGTGVFTGLSFDRKMLIIE